MKCFSRLALCAAALAAILCLPTAAAAAADIAPISAPAAPTVLLNGESVDFTDAAPQIVDGRTVLPFRSVFNALGFADESIAWDGETRTISAQREDVTIAMTIGETAVTVTRDGASSQFQTDVAPFIDSASNRTYVPARFVAEAVGYHVGWDAANRVVIIDDVEAILAANTETYQIADAYLAYSNQFATGAWAVSGAYDMSMDMADETVAVDGTYEMLIEKMAFEFDSDMVISTLSAEADAAPLELNFAMRGDMEDGVFYFKSDELMAMVQPGVSNAWFKMDFAAIMDSMQSETGMDYTQLMAMSQSATEGSFQDYIEATLRALPLTSADYTTADALAQVNAILGDSAFTKNGNDYVSVLEDPTTGLAATLTFTTDAQGDLLGYAVGMTMKQDNMMEMTFEMAMTGLEMDMNMVMSVDAGEGLEISMEMNMDGTYEKAANSPAAAPAADAAIIDVMEMLGGM